MCLHHMITIDSTNNRLYKPQEHGVLDQNSRQEVGSNVYLVQ